LKDFKVMVVYHDEIEIEDFEYDEDEDVYHYPCPCGDRFEVAKEDLLQGEDTATCPSCSLVVKIILDEEFLNKLRASGDINRLSEKVTKLEIA